MPEKNGGFALAEELVKALAVQGKTIAFAESCTAGLAADLIACVPGASRVLWGSFVSYTECAKSVMLGVPVEMIRTHGAVSEQVALAMAEGALEKSGAWRSVSITGFAGPDVEGVPVGTVWIGLAGGDFESRAKKYSFGGSRNEIRLAAAIAALEELQKMILTENVFSASIELAGPKPQSFNIKKT